MLGVSVQWCWDKHTDKTCNLHCLFSSSVPRRNWPWLRHTQISIAAVVLGLGWMETKVEVCFLVCFWTWDRNGNFFACTSSEVHKIPHWSFPAEPPRFRSETFAVTVCVNNANAVWWWWKLKLSCCFLCLKSRPVFFSCLTWNYCFFGSRWALSLNLWHFPIKTEWYNTV